MNWGTKIAMGLAAFMIFIIVLGVIMSGSKTDALVDNDYYEKGINYNKVYNRKEQVKRDHAQPVITLDTKSIVIAFKHQASGTVRLMRTADKKLDKILSFETGAGHQLIIPVAPLQKGYWRLITDWTSNGNSYLYEQEINIR
jgi:hypothetical protein